MDVYKRNEVLQQLKDAGYEPVFLGLAPQVCARTYSMGMVNQFELAIPAERQVVVDDRQMPKGQVVDLAEEARIKREIELMRQAIYGRKGK